MTTSNSTDYTITATECITMALEEIGVMGEGDQLSPYNYGVGKGRLNLLLKDWQNFAEHLWVRQKAVLFLQKNQYSYEISSTSTDNITADALDSTTLTVAAAIGATTLTVASSTGFVASDIIGVQLDSGSFFWSTVVSAPSATSILIADALTGAAGIGKYVFGYTNRLTTVFNAYSATRRLITSNIDIPLIYQSYTDYSNMPNKTNMGTPNMWSYDRQIDKFIINIWQNPSDVSYYINFVLDRKIQDIDTSIDNFDLPQEWSNPIMLNLAVALAPAYGKAQGENFQKTEKNAEAALARALRNDNELGSIHIIPSRSDIRGR